MSDSSPRKVLHFYFLSIIGLHKKLREIVSSHKTHVSVQMQAEAVVSFLLFLCKTNDVLVTPKKISLSLLHRVALQKSQADIAGFFQDTIMHPNLQQSHKGHACLYSMLRKKSNRKIFQEAEFKLKSYWWATIGKYKVHAFFFQVISHDQKDCRLKTFQVPVWGKGQVKSSPARQCSA